MVTDQVRIAVPSGAELPVAHLPGRRSLRHAGHVILLLLLPRRAARRAQTVLPAAACSDRTSSARAEIRGDRLRRDAGLLRRAPKTGGSYYDPLFERLDLVEDDYHRFRHQPYGW
jgi:hypothetical protein